MIKLFNPENMNYTDKCYHVQIGHFYSFDALVFADNEQEAIDLIIDQWEVTEESNKGYFLENDHSENEEDFISGGNCGRVTSFRNEELYMREYYKNDINIFADIDNDHL